MDCAFCGNAVETQKHVLASCQDPDILEIKQELFNDIVLLVADEAPKSLSVWLRENIEHIWGGDLGKITYATMTEVEYTEGVNLHEIHTCAWNGIIPKELVKLVQKLLSNSKHWASKNGSTANNIVGRINGLANKAMCTVWEKRKEKLKDENTTSAKSKPQSILDQAKALVIEGFLPGIGGVGKMAYSEFEALPKMQFSNKIQNALVTTNPPS